MSNIRLLWICYFFITFQYYSVGQEAEYNQNYGIPYIQNYSPEEYGAAGRNWGVSQDTLGIMYFANTDGVLTFDGAEWRTIKLQNGRQAKSIDRNAEGQIFVGGYDDIGFLSKDSLGDIKFESLLHLVPDSIRQFRDVWKTHCTQDGVFFQANEYIFRYANDSIHVIPKTARVFHVSWNVNGQFFVREHGNGLLMYKDGKLELVPGGEEVAYQVIRTLLPAGDNSYILSNSRGEYLLLDESGFTKPPLINQIQKVTGVAFIISAFQLGDGFIFNTLGEGNYLVDKKGELIHHFSKKNGIIDDTSNETFVDKDSNLWLATTSGISHILLNHPMTFAGEKLGVDRAVKNAIKKDDQLFLGSQVGILKEVDDGFEWIYETGLEVFDMEIVQDKLYAVLESYVAEITDDDQKVFIGERQYPHWRMTKLIKNPGYYVSGLYNSGLLMYKDDGTKLIQLAPIAGYKGNAASITEDEQGHLWISDGQMNIDRIILNNALDSVVSIRTYGSDDGLFEDKGNHILSLAQKNKKEILVASGPNYYSYNSAQDNFQPYAPLNGLVNGGKGIPFLQTKSGDIYTYVGGKPVRFIQEDDGYKADSLSLRKLPKNRAENIVELEDQSLLFCTSKGLIHLRPKISQDPSEIEFKTIIRNIKSSEFTMFGGFANSDLFVKAKERLGFENNSVIFTFSASYYDNPELTTYQYKLEGYDEWSEWSPATYKEYTNLNEGRYTFYVKAKNIYGKIGSTDSFSFTITPPWYRTTMSYSAYALAIILIVWGLVNLNTRRLEAENRRLEQIVTDRTLEIEEQKNELKEKNQRLVELDQFKQDMTSMVVHDLKNPLSIIIQKGEQKTSSIAKKMLNLVLNILDVQKFEDTKVEPQKESVSFKDLVEKAHSEVSEGLKEKNLKLEVNGDDYEIEVDPELIERVIINLLTNAIKYSPLNSKIVLEATSIQDHFLQMKLKDSGPGIPSEKQGIIFDRYIQSDKKVETRVKSTGLGLAFTKLAIEAHGGEVGVISNEGEGATFWFTLPVSSSKQSKIDLKKSDQSKELSEKEKEQFLLILPQLKKLKIYESIEIEELLTKLDLEEDSPLHAYVDDLLNASYNGNDEYFQELLNRYT